MKYFPLFTEYPKNHPSVFLLNHAAERLEKKLRELDYNALPVSDYCKRYYAYDLRKITYMLQAYCIMLANTCKLTAINLSELSVLDHGGGVGILSLLCKEAGVKTVIHQDINPVISKDAAVLAEALNLKADYYVSGDTPEFVRHLNENSIELNLIGSRNVIEHVYDINDFFSRIASIKSKNLLAYLNTTANMHNPLVNIYTKRLQKIYEYKGFSSEWGSRKIDSENSGVNIRKKILKEAESNLDTTTLEKLAIATRGLKKEAIVDALENYKATKTFPTPPKHPTNTCDPFTGSWVERLTSIQDYKKMAVNNGFTFKCKNGFYNTNYPQVYFNMITPIVNFFISALGNMGIYLAPFISIQLKKEKG